MAKDIKESEFKSEVEDYEGLVLVDFWAPWCPPCRALAPILEAVASEAGTNCKMIKINVDQNQQIAMDYQIRGIPTVMLFHKGKNVETVVGLASKSHYLELIKKHSVV